MSRVSLQQLLAHLPHDGLGARVFQARWVAKGLPTPASTVPASACYWDVRKTLTTATSTKAWGVLYWKGKRVTPDHAEFEPITGARKYAWATATMPPKLNPAGLFPMKTPVSAE